MRSTRREIEEEEEEIKTIDNLSHKHPLILVETSRKDYCYGCRMYFIGGEQAYGCSKRCGYTRLLHEECAGLPRRITHAMHQHALIQQHFQHLSLCSICERYIWSIGYGCKSSECEFQMHIRCAQGSGVMDAAEEDVAMRHASHPEHELRLWERPFRCVACGTTRRGKSYICRAAGCQYWIHHRCAILPETMDREDHHHSLSLSYHVPPQYIKFNCKCGVCNKYLLGIYWIYHCKLRKYAVHVKCAFKESTRQATITNIDEEGSKIEEEGENVVDHWSHIDEKGSEIEEEGENIVDHWSHIDEKGSEIEEEGENVVDLWSHIHEKGSKIEEEGENVVDHWSHGHPLSLVEVRKSIRCLGCRRNLMEKIEQAYGCTKRCGYSQLLHEECAEMSRKIRHPMHPQHQLIQQYMKHPSPCIFCEWQICGIGYRCAECEIQAHVGCAQGSNVMYEEQCPVIRHPIHHHHELRLWKRCSLKCGACGAPPRGRSYICTNCEYWIHERCTSFPQVVQRIDHHHHSLSLSFSTPLEYTKLDFKCKICYEDLVGRYWIYHCELCRYVVHLKCAFKKMPHATIRKNDEIEEEEETVAHGGHEHPLTLAETRKEAECYSCERLVASGELAYVCSKKCQHQGLLHEECGEMTTKIRHPLHPQHILSLGTVSNCSICTKQGDRFGYRCTNFSMCEFQIHTRCALDNYNDELGRTTLRQSHPQHELRLLKRSCSFRCDACGIEHRGKSYICTSCEYRIHHSCASLPETFKREDHDHELSLSFCVPLEYIEYDFKCEVCRKDLLGRFWIYHCRLCRYAVHIGCVFKKPAARINEDDEEGVILFPVYDVAAEQIRPFVMMKGEAIAPIPDDVIDAYEFYRDKHQMRLVSSSHGGRNEEENSDDEDDYGQISKLMCDGCATPIFRKQNSSFSSSSESKYHYMSCSECKYFLHLACFLLLPRLSSIPLHSKPDHELVLQTCAKLEFKKDCSFCKLPMNGLFYACKNKKCDFKADIKCATVPDTIRHAAHPQHLLKLASSKIIQSPRSCAAACNASRLDSDDYWYVCGSCKEEEEFSLHVSCATLPKSTKSLKWDKKHSLQLTFDANLNHPGEFYCDECEVQMNPKRWMYHCRDCDLSFHPDCFKTTSGECRNIKFGCRVSAVAHRQHPLTYQLLTAKRRCDVCGGDRYERRGFHCAYCNFFICFSSDCGAKMIGDGRIQAVG